VFILLKTYAALRVKKNRSGGGMQELMTYEDVSRLSKFKISTLRKWVQLRKIPFVKINGAIRFEPEAIRLWAAGQQGAKKSGAAVLELGAAD
jgi:hypothetical protein